MMFRLAAVIGALFCIAVAADVLPVSKPLSGLAVSFSKNLQSDEICKICIQESVVMCVALQLSFGSVVHFGLFCCYYSLTPFICSINEILNDGLHDIELGCKGVCGNIKSSKALQETCTVTCDALGLVEFVKLIQTKDIDPIFYCEGWRLPRCPPKPDPLLTSICL
jgi:hypothetical protein